MNNRKNLLVAVLSILFSVVLSAARAENTVLPEVTIFPPEVVQPEPSPKVPNPLPGIPTPDYCFLPRDHEIGLTFLPFGWDPQTNQWVPDSGGGVSGSILVSARMVSEKGEIDCLLESTQTLQSMDGVTGIAPNFTPMTWARAYIRLPLLTLLNSQRLIVTVRMNGNVTITYSGLPKEPKQAVFHITNPSAPDGYTEYWGIRRTFTRQSSYSGPYGMLGFPTSLQYSIFNNVSLGRRHESGGNFVGSPPILVKCANILT